MQAPELGRGRQGAGSRDRGMAVDQVGAEPAPRLAQRHAGLVAEGRRVLRRQRQAVVEPAELRVTVDHQLGHLLRPHRHAVDVDLAQVGARDVVDAGVDPRHLFMRAVERGAAGGDRIDLDVRVQMGEGVDDRLDRGLELAHALLVAGQQRHRERADRRRNLLLQYLQCRFALGGDQDAFSRRQVVADDVGDRMGLTGAGRALDRHARGARELLDDRLLFAVVGQGEVQLARFAAAGRAAGQATEGDRFMLDHGLARGRDDAERAVRNRIAGADALLQACDVVDQEMAGARTGEHDPPVRHHQRVAGVRGGGGFAVITCRCRELPGDQAQDRFDDRRVEGRDGDVRAVAQQGAGGAFDIADAGHGAGGKGVELQARLDLARTHGDGVAGVVDLEFHRLGDQGVMEVDSRRRSGFVGARNTPRRHPHAPDQLRRPHRLFGFQARLQRKQVGVQAHHLAPRPLPHGPVVPVLRVDLQQAADPCAALLVALPGLFFTDDAGVLVAGARQHRFLQGRRTGRGIVVDRQKRGKLGLRKAGRAHRFQAVHPQPDRLAIGVDVEVDPGQRLQVGIGLLELGSLRQCKSCWIDVFGLLDQVVEQPAHELGRGLHVWFAESAVGRWWSCVAEARVAANDMFPAVLDDGR